jgi:hypothetical protein
MSKADIVLYCTNNDLRVLSFILPGAPLGDRSRLSTARHEEAHDAMLCHIASTRPETTYDNFLRDFGERFVSGFKAPLAIDFASTAPFEE